MSDSNTITNCENPALQSYLNRSSQDKFILVLNLPPVLQKLSKTDSCLDINPLQLSVYGTIVPTITIPPVEIRYGGQSTNFSSHSRPNYPPLTVNFVVDNEYKNYYVLWRWLEILNEPFESTYGGTPQRLITKTTQLENGGINSEYQTDLSVIALNEYNKPIIQFNYLHAFITSLGGITYNYREGEIIDTTVEFQFSQLLVEHVKK